MYKKIILVVSLYDIASINIKNNILFLESNNLISKVKIYGSKFKVIYYFELFTLIEIKEESIYQDFIDQELKTLNIFPLCIIFLSRHSSGSKLRSLTVHSTGNYGGCYYGGNHYNELAILNPIIMNSLLLELSNLNQKYSLGCDVTLEVTHHGPVKLNVPSFFVEIGSTVNEWNSQLLGYFVALAILNIIKKYDSINISLPIFVGFGGNHYASNPTRIALSGKACFGHLFSKYQIKNLTFEFINKSIIKSQASYVYIDKKSIQSQYRKHLVNIIEELGYTIYYDI